MPCCFNTISSQIRPPSNCATPFRPLQPVRRGCSRTQSMPPAAPHASSFRPQSAHIPLHPARAPDATCGPLSVSTHTTAHLPPSRHMSPRRPKYYQRVPGLLDSSRGETAARVAPRICPLACLPACLPVSTQIVCHFDHGYERPQNVLFHRSYVSPRIPSSHSRRLLSFSPHPSPTTDFLVANHCRGHHLPALTCWGLSTKKGCADLRPRCCAKSSSLHRSHSLMGGRERKKKKKRPKTSFRRIPEAVHRLTLADDWLP
ncbi:hypothetical protein BKA80DRAFT_3149 [Phyllosticta citrichinensis]